MSVLNEMFPVQDITFRSKRKQGDWDTDIVTTTEGYFIEQPAVSTTLESVIKFLRNRKTSDIESAMIKAAIMYLEEYRMYKVENRHSGEEESVEDETGEGNAESGNITDDSQSSNNG